MLLRMMYAIHSVVLTFSLVFALAVAAISVFGFLPERRRPIQITFLTWISCYALYILLFTGPGDLRVYPAAETAHYSLPWKAGVTRFVAQGNNSFLSHRDSHQFAWDFVMENGTEILAAREGTVFSIEDSLDGIGYLSNFIVIRHKDGESSAYAHIQNKGALVKVGESVRRGQSIALSGMVGQTLFPHLHFYVLGSDGRSSIPISFREVENGVPLAGRFYTSDNK